VRRLIITLAGWPFAWRFSRERDLLSFTEKLSSHITIEIKTERLRANNKEGSTRDNLDCFQKQFWTCHFSLQKQRKSQDPADIRVSPRPEWVRFRTLQSLQRDFA
jgi:hypothetical protein